MTMGRLLRYSSSRFRPRLNEYTYPELRAVRPRVGERVTRGAPANESRSGFSPKERAESRR